jgi:NTP pyrophosphatase (non-canonical NTP hydrolase)
MSETEIYDDQFLKDVKAELLRARTKFPGDNLNMVALMEEVGELAQAALHIREGKHNEWRKVWDEAVQVAVMALRMATEGDATIATPFSSRNKP